MLTLRVGVGSSPRVRGSHVRDNIVDALHGIIPAGAGLTCSRRGSCRSYRDHPRGCGAHHALPSVAVLPAGSSPRVRGSPASVSESLPLNGIIPAGAGLTKIETQIDSLVRDHPRGCGAHHCEQPVLSGLRGSSPRVRGSLVSSVQELKEKRIIPAGAGLTSCSALLSPCRRDHPRGCGAHAFVTKHIYF